MARRKHKSKRSKITYNTSGLARYRAISSGIRESYKEQGRDYDRRTIKEEYQKHKGSLKDVPLSRLNDAIAGIYSPVAVKKDIRESDLPEALRRIDWFHFETALSDYPEFFKETDVIVLDLSMAGLDPIEFEYKDRLGKYDDNRNNIIPLMRDYSPPPQFLFAGQDGNVFSWNMQGELKEGIVPSKVTEKEALKVVPKEKEKEIVPQTEKEAKRARIKEKRVHELALAKEKTKQAELKVEEYKSAERASVKEGIREAMGMLRDKLITKAEFNDIIQALKS